jgi:hypothetical protein
MKNKLLAAKFLGGWSLGTATVIFHKVPRAATRTPPTVSPAAGSGPAGGLWLRQQTDVGYLKPPVNSLDSCFHPQVGGIGTTLIPELNPHTRTRAHGSAWAKLCPRAWGQGLSFCPQLTSSWARGQDTRGPQSSGLPLASHLSHPVPSPWSGLQWLCPSPPATAPVLASIASRLDACVSRPHLARSRLAGLSQGLTNISAMGLSLELSGMF